MPFREKLKSFLSGTLDTPAPVYPLSYPAGRPQQPMVPACSTSITQSHWAPQQSPFDQSPSPSTNLTAQGQQQPSVLNHPSTATSAHAPAPAYPPAGRAPAPAYPPASRAPPPAYPPAGRAPPPAYPAVSAPADEPDFPQQPSQAPAVRHLRRSATSKFESFKDRFNTLAEVQTALRGQGLESSNLIFAVDFTKSNTWLGERSFGGRSLHHIGTDAINPYQAVCQIIARTLQEFDDDQQIPVYGFGDFTTKDSKVFSFKAHDEPCHGLEDVLQQYCIVAQALEGKLSGPTSFAPAIYQALRIVAESGGDYHILIIIADGQVTSEGPTVKAIVEASNYPLSIIMVGVGDGPWDQQREFDDKLPQRQFDNFQFVNATELFEETRTQTQQRREALFALRALMEIPEQYKAIRDLNLLGKVPPEELLTARPRALPPPDVISQHRPHSSSTVESAHALTPTHSSASGQGLQGLGHGGQPQQLGMPYTVSAGVTPCVLPAHTGTGYGAQPQAKLHSHPTSPIASPVAQYMPYDIRLFECPITQDIMEDPVIARDGRTYERIAIEEHISRRGNPWPSPIDGTMVDGTDLLPNKDLRSRIREYNDTVQRQQQQQQQESLKLWNGYGHTPALSMAPNPNVQHRSSEAERHIEPERQGSFL